MAKYDLNGSGEDLNKLAAEMEKLGTSRTAVQERDETEEQPESQPVSSRPRALPRTTVIAAIAALAVILIGVLWWAIAHRQSRARFASVPGVVGLDAGRAQDALKAMGFAVKEDFDPTSKAAPGQVTAQNPSPNTRIQEGGTVIVTIAGKSTGGRRLPARAVAAPGTPAPEAATPAPRTAAGAPRVMVPRIEGIEMAQARRQLEALGLRVEMRTIVDVTRQPGIVLASDPRPETTVDRGTLVRVSVNAAASTPAAPAGGTAPAAGNQVTIPEYFGKASQAAMDDLRARGLTPVWRMELSQQLRSGYVIRTEPAAGSRVEPEAKVTVIIAR